MRRSFKMALLRALIVGTVVAADARCFGQGRDMEQRGFGHRFQMANELKSTPEQISQWKELKESFKSEIVPVRNQLFSKRMELAALLAQPDADPEAIKSKHGEVIALRGELQEKAMDHRLAFRKTLTPEQLSLWIARKTAWHGGRSEMGHGREGYSGEGMHHGSGMGPCCSMGPDGRSW